MDFSPTIHRSPSFNTNPSNDIVNTTNRVVLDPLTENNFNDNNNNIFSFTDNNNNNICEVNTNHQIDKEAPDEDEHEFEFPVMSINSNSFHISSELVSNEQISKRYPLFDRSLLLNDDVNGVNTSITESQPPPSTPSSLLKLFNEDLETSSSESDDLDGVTPGTYCVWKPKTELEPRGKHKHKNKHKKSSSVSIGSTSNRWNVRDLLKRIYSDDGYCDGKESPVLLFIPPMSPEKVIGKTKSGKTENKKIPVYNNMKVGSVCYSPYLPYREDQLAAYANFNGGNKNIYRY